MKNILITGAVLNKTQEDIEFYKNLISSLSYEQITVCSPLDTLKFNGTNEERFELAKHCVETADIIIAEVSNASHGQGMELMYAKLLNKKVIFISKEKIKISGLIKGAFPNAHYFTYQKNLSKKQISSIIEQLYDDIREIL